MIYLIHLLRWFKNFLKFPIQSVIAIINDIFKDIKNKKSQKKVLIIGVPKSGTTIVENIFQNLGYVNQARSFLRLFDDKNLLHPHDLSEKMLKRIPQNKKTFLKRHTHYSKKNLYLIKKYEFKTIFIFRNLKDIMISRYLHILNWKNHWQHAAIKNLDTVEGFKKSLTYNVGHEKYDIPIIYYYDWLKNWKKVLKNHSDFCILKYDNFKKKPNPYIKKIISFVGEDTRKVMYIKKKINLKKNEEKFFNNLNSKLNPNTYNKQTKIYRKELSKVNIKKIIRDLKRNRELF